MIKIAATADLHLGRKSTQVPSGFQASTKTVLRKITEFCIREDVDVLLLAGDVIDRENRFFEAYEPLRNALTELTAAGITIYLVAGNHDFDSLPGFLKALNNEKVFLVGAEARWETLIYEKSREKLQITGWSFAQQYSSVSPFDNFDPALVRDSLPGIGLIHGDYYDGSSPYALLNHPALLASEIDVWVFGHIHKPEVIKEKNPLIFYPGSPQALSPKEKGRHGMVTLIAEAGTVRRDDFHLLSDVIYEDLKIEIPAKTETSDLATHIMAAFHENLRLLREKYGYRLLVLDVHFTGVNPDVSAIREMQERLLENEEIAENTVIRKVETKELKPRHGDLAMLSGSKNITGSVARIIRALESEDFDSGAADEILEEVRRRTADLKASKTYSPVGGELEDLFTEEKLREMILAEARLILTHFTEQLNRTEYG